MKKNKLPVIALIYDFDGTLSPANMQEFGFIQAIGKDPESFWKKSTELSISQDASPILCYMRLMLDEAKAKGIDLRRESFQDFGSKIELFDGVKEWFGMINEYGKSKNLTIRHYINSSGLKEMIEGTPIFKEFENVYACSFMYDENNNAMWPAVAVDYTTKTQFIFKINKGIDSVMDNDKVNRYVPDNKRPIPFRQMIYFGDGCTDIPCMRLIKHSGGHSIAVYNPKNEKTKAEFKQLNSVYKLLEEDRVNFVCPADYRSGTPIHTAVLRIIDKIKAELELEKLPSL